MRAISYHVGDRVQVTSKHSDRPTCVNVNYCDREVIKRNGQHRTATHNNNSRNFYAINFPSASAQNAHQTRIKPQSRNEGRHQKVNILRMLGENAILKIYVMIFLRYEDSLPADFNVVGRLFQILGAATEKARLPRFISVLGTES